MKKKNKISKGLENKVSMYIVVLSWCMKNLPIISLIPAVLDAYQIYKTLVADIRSLIKQKMLITTGLSTNKKKTKVLLAEHAMLIADALYAFATKTLDDVLRAKVKYTMTYLVQLRDNLFIEECNTIYELGMEHLADLAFYNIDGNTMQTLFTSTDLYSQASPLPTGAVKHRAVLTSAIDAKEIEIDDFKKSQLDKVIKLLKPDNKSFVDEYFSRSRIIDAGMRHNKAAVITPEEVGYIALNIVDKDGNPVEGVTTKMISGDKVLTDETDEDGDGYHEKVTVGKWTLTIEMFGYKKITVEDLEFTGNDEFEMDFVLEDEEVVPPVES